MVVDTKSELGGFVKVPHEALGTWWSRSAGIAEVGDWTRHRTLSVALILLVENAAAGPLENPGLFADGSDSIGKRNGCNPTADVVSGVSRLGHSQVRMCLVQHPSQ